MFFKKEYSKIELEKRIKEIACIQCKDYPKISSISSFEQLWAIESSINGIKKANEDCHAVIEELRKRLNISIDDLISIYDKLKRR